MAGDWVGSMPMFMSAVKAEIRPWIDKDGNPRYYINHLSSVIEAYRTATHTQLNSYYDWVHMCASGGRVREIIEGNILPKTKAFIGSDGRVHVYGWATAGVGAEMKLPALIEMAIAHRFGMASEEIRQACADALIGECGDRARVGDVVRIVKGRKAVGHEFTVSAVSRYQYSIYARPSVYLIESEDFKVNADNCEIIAVGDSCDMDGIQ